MADGLMRLPFQERETDAMKLRELYREVQDKAEEVSEQVEHLIAELNQKIRFYNQELSVLKEKYQDKIHDINMELMHDLSCQEWLYELEDLLSTMSLGELDEAEYELEIDIPEDCAPADELVDVSSHP